MAAAVAVYPRATRSRLARFAVVTRSLTASAGGHQSLPVVDVSTFRDASRVGGGDVREAERLHKACTDVGFFYLRGHGVPDRLCSELRIASGRFFAQEAKTKLRATTRAGFRGYQWLGQNVTMGRKDRHEAVDLMRELPLDHPLRSSGWAEAHLTQTERTLAEELLGGHNPPLSYPPELAGLVSEYVERMLEVGAATVRMMAIGLSNATDGKGVNYGDIVALTRDPWWIMRLIHYPARGVHESSTESSGGGSADVNRKNDGASAAAAAGGGGARGGDDNGGGGGGYGHAAKMLDEGDGCGVHTDYGLLTIIGSQTPGVSALEVRDVEGRWIRAEPPEGCFVCNIGDMMARLTNGLYMSTPHRVVTHPHLDRISVPFFFEPSFDARVGESMYGQHLLGKLATNLLPSPEAASSLGT